MLRRLVLTLLVAAATPVAAQDPAGGGTMGKRVTLHARDISLRDALDRLAALADVRISYSGDNLPLDRRVEIARNDAALSDVLAALLRPYAVEVVVVAANHLVLTPRAPATAPAADSAGPPRPTALLDRVVVTGSVFGAPERPLPIALDVVSGRDLEQRDRSRMSQVLDGSVPGVFVWEQAPTSMLARYGSIRGASSFGVSYPKIYIDGIEVANPLLMTQIAPELIERVEVIRGPQGAALYGSDAISGVINIVSRHESAGSDGVNVRLRTQGGYANSSFSHAVPVQEHVVTLRSGSNLRAAGLTAAASTSGEYIPDAYSREFRANGDVRVIGARSTLTATARVLDKEAGVPLSPLLPQGYVGERLRGDSQPQQLRMYSLGSTLTMVGSEHATYAITAGIDGYSLANVANQTTPIPFFVDSALRAAGGAATRASVRASSVTRTGAPERATATLTIAAEHSMLRDRSLAELELGAEGAGDAPLPTGYQVTWTTNTGVTTQANVGIRDALFLTAGLRNEYIGQSRGQASQFAVLPMLGAALVGDANGATGKLRVAYGRGVRAARATPTAGTSASPVRVANPGLAPEEQSGFEAGFDLLFGRRAGIHVTRFDQVAFGLVQDVTIRNRMSDGTYRYLYQPQNVGAITNRGWETQANAAFGPMHVAGAASFVSSRVRSLANGYTGDLRVGDRMLGVPARTVSATATLVQQRFEISSTVSRASDWVNYDRLAIAQCYIDNCGASARFSGPDLRNFWMEYPGSTRLRSAVSVGLPRGFTLIASGENLLNQQRGEPDSITIVPGRTITLGLRARF